MELLLSTAAVDFAFVGASLSWVVRRQVIRRLRSDLLFNPAPDSIHALLVVEPFENSIATDHEEIEVIFQFETANLGVANNHILITSVLLLLSLDVSKRSRDGQSTREDS